MDVDQLGERVLRETKEQREIEARLLEIDSRLERFTNEDTKVVT